MTKSVNTLFAVVHGEDKGKIYENRLSISVSNYD